MAEARSREGWSRTSAVLAMTANCHRDPKKSKLFTPADFNPHEQTEKNKPLVRTKNLGILKQVFVNEEKGK